MANDVLGFQYTETSVNLYAIIRNNNGEAYNGSAFETYVTANRGNYDIPLTEQGTASKYYDLTLPAIDAGTYDIHIYLQAGGSPAESDTNVGVGSFDWTGTAIPGPSLRPTTSGRTVDVSLGGEVGLDWANVGSQSTTVNLSATTFAVLNGHTPQTGDAFARLGAPAGASISVDIAAVKTQTNNIESDTTDIQNRIPTSLIGGRMDSNVGAISSDASAADNMEAFFDGTGYSVTVVAGSLGATAKAEVAAEVDLSLAVYDGPTKTEMDAAFAALNDISNADVDQALLDAGVTTTRTAYLDKLNISGNVASSSEVTAIQNNTKVVRVVPDVIEIPDSGTTTYRVELLLYDTVGNMEAPDSAPTIALVNQSGTDRSGRLDSTTMSLISTGRYRSEYTASSSDTLEQLVWTFSVVEGGNTRVYGNSSLIVNVTAVDFTATDRAKLDQLAADYTTARAAKLENLDATISSRLAGASYVTPLDAAGIRGAVGLSTANLDTQLSGIAAKTDQLTFGTANRVNVQVYGMEADVLTASALNNNAVVEIANTILSYEAENVEDTASEMTIAGLILAAFRSSYTSTTWTINKTDGTTVFATLPLVTNSNPDFITSVGI